MLLFLLLFYFTIFINVSYLRLWSSLFDEETRRTLVEKQRLPHKKTVQAESILTIAVTGHSVDTSTTANGSDNICWPKLYGLSMVYLTRVSCDLSLGKITLPIHTALSISCMEDDFKSLGAGLISDGALKM